MGKKEEILEKATRLFAEKGYAGTSVRDLAADVGINIAMVNYYFGSKEKLFEEVVAYRTSYLKGVFTGISNDKSLTAFQKIEEVIKSLMNRMFDNPSFHHLIYRELSLDERPELHTHIVDILLANTAIIKKILSEGIRNGEFEKVDTDLTVATLIGSLNQLLVSNLLTKTFINSKNNNLYADKKFRKRVTDHIILLMRRFLINN